MSVAISRLRNRVLVEMDLGQDKAIHGACVKQRPPDSGTQEGLWSSTYMGLMPGQVHGFPGWETAHLLNGQDSAI